MCLIFAVRLVGKETSESDSSQCQGKRSRQSLDPPLSWSGEHKVDEGSEFVEHDPVRVQLMACWFLTFFFEQDIRFVCCAVLMNLGYAKILHGPEIRQVNSIQLQLPSKIKGFERPVLG